MVDAASMLLDGPGFSNLSLHTAVLFGRVLESKLSANCSVNALSTNILTIL